MSNLLPAGFEGLDPFVAQWAVAGTANRDTARSTSTAEQRISFFEAAKEIMPKALTMLDEKPLDSFDEKEERLMNLALSFAHVTLSVEMLGDAEPRHARFRAEMPFTRSSADL